MGGQWSRARKLSERREPSSRDPKKGQSIHAAEADVVKEASEIAKVPLGSKRSSSLFAHRERKDSNQHNYQSYEVIIAIPFFEDLTPTRAKQLSTLFERKVFNEDDIIIKEGSDMDHSFFVIIQGAVKLIAKRNRASQDEKDLTSEAGIVHLADLEKGACFGTTALIDNSVKAVPLTAIAQVKNTIIMSITHQKFKDFADSNDLFPCLKANASFSVDNPEPLSVLFRLRSMPFFSGINDYLLRQLGVLFEFRRYKAGEALIEQGDKLDGFYVLVKGVVEITVTVPPNNEQKHFGTLKPQDCFGELSLVEHTVNLTTYRARTEVLVIVLKTEKFEKFLTLAPEVVQHPHFKNLIHKRTSDALKRIPIFFSTYQTKQKGPMEQYDEKSLDLLASLFQFVEYREGDYFYKQGEAANAFYIIVQGQVQVWSEAAVDGTQDVQVEELEDGNWFGEIALCNREEKESLRTESVTALTKTVVLRLSIENFSQFRNLAPGVTVQIEQRLSMKTAKKLENIPFFHGIRENKPWSKIGLLGSLFKYELYEAGAVICKEGDIGDKFYVIVDGKVGVSAKGENSEEETELETLGDNKWFGEMSLLLNTPRFATVTAKVTSVVISLSSTAFKRFLEIAPELSSSFQTLVTSRTANTLKRFEFFKAVKENRAWNKLELLASLMIYEVHDANETVFKRGEKGDKFYIIAQGAVDVFVDGKEPDPSQLTKIDHLEEGAYFGEIALLEETPRTATVVTTKRSVLLAITHESFKRFLGVAQELKPIIQGMIKRRKRTLSKGMQEEFSGTSDEEDKN